MPLTMARAGESNIIQRVTGRDEVRRHLAEGHVRAIDAKVDELLCMRRTLTDLIERCHGDDRPDCPILDGLSSRHPKAPA